MEERGSEEAANDLGRLRIRLVEALVRLFMDRMVWFRAVVSNIVLCSWARHFTLTVPLWVPVKLMLGVNANGLATHPGGGTIGSYADFTFFPLSSTSKASLLWFSSDYLLLEVKNLGFSLIIIAISFSLTKLQK